MTNRDVQVNSFKAWVLAARPKTLTAAAVPLMIALALALCDSAFAIRIVPAVLCFLFAFIMQIDANLVNDYYDFVRGNDDETRLGPKRACAQGWITTKSMRNGILFTTFLACLVGFPLVFYGGWQMVAVGLLCVLFCFLYTTHLSYNAMGDILVILFFGLIPVLLSYYLMMPQGICYEWYTVALAAISCGLVIDALLVVNNYRDMENDIKANKLTLVTKIGKKASEFFYLLLGVTAFVLGVIAYSDRFILAAWLPLLYLLLHIQTFLKMIKIGVGQRLNTVLELTARNIFIYGLLVFIGLIFSN